jgi:FAD/FMN-containing dehydrogenase
MQNQDVAALAETLTGSAIGPGHSGYDAARAVHNGLIDRRPAVIVQCRDTADVVDAVRFARDHDLEISVRGGGHNVAGNAVTEGGLMIDTAPMKGVLVDPEQRVAACQPGVNWGEFNRATQLYGLACTGGVISTTGVSGLTLGGGIGWLMGRFGLALDNLIGAELVNATGEVLQVSRQAHPDLFWALRGGGGNFGVVTRFDFTLHRLGPMVIGGALAWPLTAATDVLDFYRDRTANGLPDEMELFATVQYAPDGSGVPVVILITCHSGAEADARRAIEPLRAFGKPVMDTIGPISYCAQNAQLDGGFPRGARNYWRTNLLDQFDADLPGALVEQFRATPSPISALLIEHIHGAVRRVAPTDTAFAHRNHPYNLLVMAQWEAPADDAANLAWVGSAHEALGPHLASAAYSNYMTDDEGSARVQSAYGPNYARLREIKRACDPDNVFHLNQNIVP